MKSNLKKILAVVITVVICSALTVTGLAVSAAGHHNAAFDSVEKTFADRIGESTPALQDGVWKAEYSDGTICYFIIDQNEESFTILNADKMIGIPSRYEYDESIGLYKMHIGSVDNTENWRVIDNSGDTAFVKDANGDMITLIFLSENTEGYLS